MIILEDDHGMKAYNLDMNIRLKYGGSIYLIRMDNVIRVFTMLSLGGTF